MKRVLPLILSIALVCSMLAGCGNTDEPYIPTGDGLTWDEDYTGPTTATQPDNSVRDMALAYNPKASMNPYFCTDITNRTLFSLIYQGLFTVDRNYNVEPMLCGRFHVSNDMTEYTFYVDSKATFSDGTRVTIQDAEATLRFAITSKVYSGRFSRISDMEITPDGGLKVYLRIPYENLPLLLDIPILKADQLESPNPIGSGPYKLSGAGSFLQLTRQANWWCQADTYISAPVISLTAADTETAVRDEFQFGDVDLVQADPGSDKYVDYLSDFELWDTDNGIFLFLVVHEDSFVFSDPRVRAALTHAIDREFLVTEYYRGFARSATLPASPQFPYYNKTLASKYEYEAGAMEKALAEAGMTGWPITLLVHAEDSLRLRVARAIAEMLEEAGLVVELKTVTSKDYVYVRNNEEYDLHLGQTMLSPNMDLSYFFAYDTSLSCGGLDDLSCYTLCQQALENHGNYYSLHKTIMDNGYLCPILFRSYAVYATRGLLTDLTPARDNIFYYSIGKTVEAIQF